MKTILILSLMGILTFGQEKQIAEKIEITEFRYNGADYKVDDAETLDCGTEMIRCHTGNENALERFDYIFFIKDDEVMSFYDLQTKTMFNPNK